MVDTIRGAGFQSHNLLLALDAGEPYRVARALAMEAAFLSSEGGPTRKRFGELFAYAEAMAQRVAHPHALGLTALVRGNADYFCGQWKSARQQCESAESIFRDRCTGVAWEMSAAQTFSLWSLLWLGEIREYARRVAALVLEAQERGDLFAMTAFLLPRGQYEMPAADRVDEGRRGVDEAMRRWSREGFQLPHWWEVFALGALDLYEGGDRCERRVAERAPELAGSMLLRIQVLRIEWMHLRARAALGAAAAGGDRAALLRTARTLAAAMKREKMPWSDALATLVLAGVASSSGDAERARTLLEVAERSLDACDMRLFAAAARRRRGQLIGGDEGAAAIGRADAAMVRETVARPARFAAMLAPGFPD
jgi:hypothetical protein